LSNHAATTALQFWMVQKFQNHKRVHRCSAEHRHRSSTVVLVYLRNDDSCWCVHSEIRDSVVTMTIIVLQFAILYMPDDKQWDSISRDFRHLPRCKWDLCFSGSLAVYEDLDCSTLEDGTDRLFRNVVNHQTTLRNIPEQRKSQRQFCRQGCLTVYLLEISKTWIPYVMLKGNCRQAATCVNVPTLSTQAYTHFYIIIPNIWSVRTEIIK